jgi:hypothetical protein
VNWQAGLKTRLYRNQQLWGRVLKTRLYRNQPLQGRIIRPAPARRKPGKAGLKTGHYRDDGTVRNDVGAPDKSR